MMSITKLRTWLLKQPKPGKLLVRGDDGVTHSVDVKSSESWVALAETVSALHPEEVRAFTETGELIRACRPAEEADDEEAVQADVGGVPVNTADPESMRMVTFARLIAEAYKHSNETAFQTLSDIVQAMTQRATSLERTADNLREAVTELAVQRAAAEAAGEAGAGGTLEQQMLSAFMTGKQEAAAPKAQPTNGVKPPGVA